MLCVMSKHKNTKFNRTETITIRVTRSDRDLLEYAAGLDRRSVSSYINAAMSEKMDDNMDKILAFKKLAG